MTRDEEYLAAVFDYARCHDNNELRAEIVDDELPIDRRRLAQDALWVKRRQRNTERCL